MMTDDAGKTERAIAAAAARFAANDPDGALAALGAAEGRDAFYLRAMALGRLGQLGPADAAFDAAVAAGAPPVEARLNQARAHRRHGDDRGALDATALLEPEQRSLAIRVLRSAALAALGEMEAAAREALAALPLAANDPAALTNLGATLTKADRPRDAQSALARADGLRPDHPITLNNLASAKRKAGDLDGAVADLRRASRAAPANADIAANLARALTKAGHPDAADEAYGQAIALAPLRVDIHQDCALDRWERGDVAGYLDSFDRAPDDPFLLTAKGYLALSADDKPVAEDSFARALALAPSAASALAGFAQAASDDRAEERWRRAFALAPTDGAVRLGLAQWVLGHDGEHGAREAETLLSWDAPNAYAVRTKALLQTARRVLGAPDDDALAGVSRGFIEAPAAYGGLASFLRAVSEALASQHAAVAPPLGQTLFGGTQTRGELFETSDPVLLDLRTSLVAAARQLTAKPDLRMTGAWSIRLSSGGGHVDHIHPDGEWSSSFYVDVPEDMTGAGTHPGHLRLGRPGVPGLDLPALQYVRPEPGMIVLFPAHVWHGVEAFEAETPRLTAPADYAGALR